jgi:hypothetical protein
VFGKGVAGTGVVGLRNRRHGMCGVGNKGHLSGDQVGEVTSRASGTTGRS